MQLLSSEEFLKLSDVDKCRALQQIAKGNLKVIGEKRKKIKNEICNKR